MKKTNTINGIEIKTTTVEEKKLIGEKVQEIRQKYKKGKHGIGNILAEEYQVTPAVISEIINKKRNYGYY